MHGNKTKLTEYLPYGGKTLLWHFIMLALTVGGGILVPVLRQTGQAVPSLYYIFTVVLALCAAVYAFFFEPEAAKGVLFWLTPLLYLISFAFILLPDRPLLLPFWSFGGILLLCAFGVRYGMLLNYFFLFLIGSTQPKPSVEALVMQALCLLLLGIVMFYVKKWGDAVNVIISLAALIVSVRIIFFLVVKQEILNLDIFWLAAVYTGVVTVSLLFSKMLRGNPVLQVQQDCSAFLEELAAGMEEPEAGIAEEGNPALKEPEQSDAEFQTGRECTQKAVQESALREERSARLRKLCDEKAPLLIKLSREYSTAFLHARRVALVAGQTAEQLQDVDSLLVMTGGYYHEIGRLKGRNTLENTLAVAEQEAFPEALQNILREHTVNGENPSSKEAAVLFLTDNICTMCEYLKKTHQGNLLIEKVIDKAFSLRVAKGDLGGSGLTIKDFSIIRNTMAEIIKEDMF